jgi:hypothetical protein
MKGSYRKDLASHPGPESCVGHREAAGEALTGEHTDQVLSCETRWFGVPTPLTEVESHTGGGAARQQGLRQANRGLAVQDTIGPVVTTRGALHQMVTRSLTLASFIPI